VVSRKTQLVLPCSRPEQSSAKPVWELPVEVGLDILKHKSAGTLFSGWKQLAFNWQKENLAGRIYRDPEGQSVLELDGYVEMVVLAGDRLGTEDELLKRCGKPPVAKSAAGGMLWSYGAEWTALVSEGKVKEIWVAKE